MPPQTAFNKPDTADVTQNNEVGPRNLSHSSSYQAGANFFESQSKDNTANLHGLAIVDGSHTVATGGDHSQLGTGVRPTDFGQTSAPAEAPVNPLGTGGIKETDFGRNATPAESPVNPLSAQLTKTNFEGHTAPAEAPVNPLGGGGVHRTDFDPTTQPLDGPMFGDRPGPTGGVRPTDFDPTTQPLDGPRFGDRPVPPALPTDGPIYHPDGSTLQTNYDGTTVLTKPDQSTVHADKNGNVTEVDRADGSKTSFTYDSNGQMATTRETDMGGHEYYNGPVDPGSMKVDSDGTIHRYGIKKDGSGTYEGATKYTDGTDVSKDENGNVDLIVTSGNLLYNSHEPYTPPATTRTDKGDDGTTFTENPDGSKVFVEQNGTEVNISKSGLVSFGKQTPGDTLESNGDPQVKTLTGDVPVPAGLAGPPEPHLRMLGDPLPDAKTSPEIPAHKSGGGNFLSNDMTASPGDTTSAPTKSADGSAPKQDGFTVTEIPMDGKGMDTVNDIEDGKIVRTTTTMGGETRVENYDPVTGKQTSRDEVDKTHGTEVHEKDFPDGTIKTMDSYQKDDAGRYKLHSEYNANGQEASTDTQYDNGFHSHTEFENNSPKTTDIEDKASGMKMHKEYGKYYPKTEDITYKDGTKAHKDFNEDGDEIPAKAKPAA